MKLLQLYRTRSSSASSLTDQLLYPALVAVSCIALSACGGDEEEVDTSTCTAEEVSYEAHIKPLISNKCLGCHSSSNTGDDRNGAPSGANFNSYADLENIALDMATRAIAGTMPPENNVLDISPLSQDERDCFATWRDADFRENAP